MKHRELFALLGWIQILFSLIGGASVTVGLWLSSTAYVTSRIPFTWVFGSMLFVFGTSTCLMSVVIVSTNEKLRRIYIFIGVMATLVTGWSVYIMYDHPLVVTTTPCPAGTYGAPDMTNCLPCRCVNGKCSDGRNGDGSCECDVRWRGRYCDRCDKHVLRNMGNPDGPALCDFCEPGWAMPACKTCYQGYTGEECDQCSNTVQRYEYVSVEEYAEGVEGWGEHPEWGLNPWGERRDQMIPIYGSETVNNVEMLRCDGCRREGDVPTGAVVRNTRFCTEVNCNLMDPDATIAENAMPEIMQYTATECFDDYDCSTWYCFKNQKTPKGVCAAFSREKMGCTCAAFGAVGALCLFCDAVSEVRPCGEGNCVWNVFDQPGLRQNQAVNITYGQVECMCRNGADVGGQVWTRYPKDLTTRRELDGTLNLKNASCTKRTDVLECADNTFGKHCLPCRCSGHGVCAETIEGDGSCKCTLDNTFSLVSAGMWGGELCDRCLEDCTLSDTCVAQFETGYGGSNNDFSKCPGALVAQQEAEEWQTKWGYIYE